MAQSLPVQAPSSPVPSSVPSHSTSGRHDMHILTGQPPLLTPPPPGAAVQMHEVQSGLNKTEFKVEGYTDVEEGAPHNLEEAWAIYAGER